MTIATGDISIQLLVYFTAPLEEIQPRIYPVSSLSSWPRQGDQRFGR